MLLTEQLQKKWASVLDFDGLPKIKDSYRKAVTAILLENQERETAVERQMLSEDAPTNHTGASISNYDPILISLVRRALPNLIAYDVAGVQPMTGPTGLIFAMRSRTQGQTGPEAFYSEANTEFTGFANGATAFGSVQGSDTSNNPHIIGKLQFVGSANPSAWLMGAYADGRIFGLLFLTNNSII